MTLLWTVSDRQFVEDRYTDLSGNGIAPAILSAEIIYKEMGGKYSYDSVENLIYVIRKTYPVPPEFRADVESGVIQKAIDGEHCAQCSMPLYYRMQKNGKFIHSWFCPWCHTEEYIMDWRAKTNRKPVGEQDYRNIQDKDGRVVG